MPDKVWKYIRIDALFRDLLPDIKSYTHKMRGKNGRGNDLSFTPAELKAIKKAIKELQKLEL